MFPWSLPPSKREGKNDSYSKLQYRVDNTHRTTLLKLKIYRTSTMEKITDVHNFPAKGKSCRGIQPPYMSNSAATYHKMATGQVTMSKLPVIDEAFLNCKYAEIPDLSKIVNF
jgi:hypothetical protein